MIKRWKIGQTYKDRGNRRYTLLRIEGNQLVFDRENCGEAYRDLNGEAKNWDSFSVIYEESFDISTATDQELADEYRRMCLDYYEAFRDARLPVRQEIIRRGYTIRDGDGRPFQFAPNPAIIIDKMKTEKVSI